MYSFPFTERMRASPQINGYIKDFAIDHPHQFPLRMLNLIMQPAKDIPCRKGMVVLNKPVCDAQVSKHLFVIALEKKTAIVAKHAWLQHPHAFKGGWNLFHRSIETGMTAWLEYPFT